MSRAVLFALLAGFASQQLLTPVLAPLSRQLHLSDWQLGLVITVAATALTVASPLWGRAVDRWGNRKVLLAGLGFGRGMATRAWPGSGRRRASPGSRVRRVGGRSTPACGRRGAG